MLGEYKHKLIAKIRLDKNVYINVVTCMVFVSQRILVIGFDITMPETNLHMKCGNLIA